MLSAEPDLYPLEPNVVPISYELNALRVMQPYWSCEGHEDGQGLITKMPAIWFYVEHSVYVDLLVGHIHALRFRGGLHEHWEVACLGAASATAACSGYTLKPVIEAERCARPSHRRSQLKDLHSDLRVLAACFKEHMYALARNELQKL